MTLKDAAARERIERDTSSTLFVNAGAGSGKTTALVSRVYSLVIEDEISLRNIAAVTFTEKAGAELRDRLRTRFEEARRNSEKLAADVALDDLDSAPIGTLHSFAQRILSEHPIDAGLPPLVEVLDEVGSSIAFEERWQDTQRELLDDDSIARPLLLAMAAGLELKHVRSLMLAMGRDWDMLETHILGHPRPSSYFPDLGIFRHKIREVLDLRNECTKPAQDKLIRFFDPVEKLRDELDRAPDEETRLSVLQRFAALTFNYGARGNWTRSPDVIKSEAKELPALAKELVADVLDRCLRVLTPWVAERVLHAANGRRAEGRLEFHDLLVLSRDLLRTKPSVRAALHDRYQRILLDEFQDTDPLQIDIAVRIATGENASAEDWRDIDVPAGRLFVVGDAKQSIYRFRRANVTTYLAAQKRIGESVNLTTNFRTVPGVLDWVNAVFSELIQAETGQPEYQALDHYRAAGSDGAAVTVLGVADHDKETNAAELRERESADVAAAIHKVIDEKWRVLDPAADSWRPAKLADIVILVPARTSLPFLEAALDKAGISYRAESSSLVYHFSEVRALLACARAIADPSDELSLVTALRSSLFGCGDDDLWRWKQAGGRFSIIRKVDGSLVESPVGRAMSYLRDLHFKSRWMAPSEVLTKIIADRRMFEVAAGERRSRDSWRRLRFVVDQARAWSEVSHGGLRGYLLWAAHQGTEVGRVAESVLPETDVEAVRIMTVHAAKGLEFPVVIMSGMTAQHRNGFGVQLLWRDNGYEVKLKKEVQTGDFDEIAPIDEQMDALEKKRLLYVAATRARDHLIVSLHRKSGQATSATLITEAGGATAAGAESFTGHDHPGSIRPEVRIEPPTDWDTWLAGITAARQSSRLKASESASGRDGTEPEIALDPNADPGSAKGQRDADLPPWAKGRYGSEVGRAVHAVLQTVDLVTGAGLDEAVAAQALAEGVVEHQEVVSKLAKSALASPLVTRAAASENWREMFVGTVKDDGQVLEGFIDLAFREEDGSLHVVDYKTDAVPVGAIPSRVQYYAPQMHAYATALNAATGLAVKTTLLFLHPNGAVAAPVSS